MTTRASDRLRSVILVAALASAGMAAGQSQKPLPDENQRVALAADLLARARQAAGGDDSLNRITGLSAAIRVRRFVEYISVTSPTKAVRRRKVLKGRIDVDMQLPDKFRKHVSIATFSRFPNTYVEVVNGDRAWRDPPLRAESSSPQRHVIDVSDFERSLAFQAQNARQQLSFFTLALLVRVFPSWQLNFRSAGWMKTEAGQAEVINVQGPDDSRMRLLLDRASRMLTAFDSSFAAVVRLPVVVEGSSLTRAGMIAMVQKAMRERRAQEKSQPQLSRIEIRFSDHRRIEGVLLPHRISTYVGGKLVEEMVVTSYRINPRFAPKTFEPKSTKS